MTWTCPLDIRENMSMCEQLKFWNATHALLTKQETEICFFFLVLLSCLLLTTNFTEKCISLCFYCNIISGWLLLFLQVCFIKKTSEYHWCMPVTRELRNVYSWSSLCNKYIEVSLRFIVLFSKWTVQVSWPAAAGRSFPRSAFCTSYRTTTLAFVLSSENTNCILLAWTFSIFIYVSEHRWSCFG